MRRIEASDLPEEPLEAAAQFYAQTAPGLDTDEDLLIVFPSADHRHRGWREAAVQELARTCAPHRINAVVGDDAAAIDAAAAYLAAAPGVTGQVLVLDSQGAGAVVDEGA